MKRIFFFLILAFSLTISFGQDGATKKLLQEIEGQWSLDDNGNVTYVKVIEVAELGKDEIYSRAENYFIYNYGSGKSVIQAKDKDAGNIVAKGIYDEVHIGISLITTYVDCWHIARVDVKEGKARIILTLTEFEKKIVGGSTPPSYITTQVAENFPINPKGVQKTVMGKAFYKAHLRALGTIEAIEKAIREGNTSSTIENESW